MSAAITEMKQIAIHLNGIRHQSSRIPPVSTLPRGGQTESSLSVTTLPHGGQIESLSPVTTLPNGGQILIVTSRHITTWWSDRKLVPVGTLPQGGQIESLIVPSRHITTWWSDLNCHQSAHYHMVVRS